MQIFLSRKTFLYHGGAKSERLVFHKLAEKGLPKKINKIYLYYFGVARCTGVPIITLKHGKS